MGPTSRTKQGLAPLPMVKDAHEPCLTLTAAIDRWVQFFSAMEGGQRVDAEQQRTMWRDNLQQLRTWTLDIPITELPTLCELGRVCRQVSPGKASGLDRIPTELLKYCLATTAKMLYTLLLKVCLQRQEPLAHKGGLLIPIWKGKLSRDLCSAFRSILISSTVGKALHKALRTKQSDLYDAYLHPQQLGGRRKIPVVLGGHLIRAFLRLCGARNQLTAVLFIDLQEAFYRVVRPLAISGPWTDEMVASIAQKLHLDDGTLHDLRAHLAEPSAIHQAGMSDVGRRAIKALHTDTFFQVPGQHDRVVTSHGSRPGDSYADVIFGYLMSRVLHRFEQQLQGHGILSEFPVEEGIRLHDSAASSSSTSTFRLVGPCWMERPWHENHQAPAIWTARLRGVVHPGWTHQL
eukprot:s717_g14.t1